MSGWLRILVFAVGRGGSFRRLGMCIAMFALRMVLRAVTIARAVGRLRAFGGIAMRVVRIVSRGSAMGLFGVMAA